MIQTYAHRAAARLIAATMLFLSACGGQVDAPAAPQGTTVLVYMIGSDLESGGKNPSLGGEGTLNINEMLLAHAPANANVVIETGGANQSYRVGPVPDWKNVRRLSVDHQNLTEVENLGPVDMGQPQTLTDFITWAKRTYPARNYRLVLWDHGGGWTGYGVDENFDRHGFSVAQLAQSIQAAVAATGIHFDVIGFDACLMASVEVASALTPYADYLLASQENEPGSGWNWQALVQNASADPRTFGKIVADAYLLKQAQDKQPRDSVSTLSLVDLSKIAPVRAALVSLSQQLSPAVANAQSWLAIAQARSASLSFGGSDETDIVSLTAHLGNESLAAEAASVLSKATAAAVVYSRNGSVFKDAGGLSVYFPATAVDARTPAAYANIPFDTDYKSLVTAYASNGAKFPNLLTIDTTGTTSAAFTARYNSTFGVRSLDRALVTAPGANSTVVMVGTTPIAMQPTERPTGLAQISRAGTWLTLNGYPVVFIDKNSNGDDDTADGRHFYNVPLQVDGDAVALRVAADSEGNLVALGIARGNADTSRLDPLPDSTSEIRTLGFIYDTTQDKFGSLTPVSPAFHGDLAFSSTTVSATYAEGLFITNFRGDYRLSALFPRT